MLGVVDVGSRAVVGDVAVTDVSRGVVRRSQILLGVIDDVKELIYATSSS